MTLQVIILAAGKGTRMYSDVPKVLHKLGGRPLLEHVINTALKLQPSKVHVVYGMDSKLVREYFDDYDVNWIEQSKQLGTGHAVMQAMPHVEDASKVLILYGDVPLISVSTLEKLIADMPDDGLNLLTAKVPNPSGLGRIVRDDSGAVISIIEHKDASPEHLQIKEINSGILVAASKILRKYLPRLSPHNAQGEYYLTDVIGMLCDDSGQINCLVLTDPKEVSGINDRRQLTEAERHYQKDVAKALMEKGLGLADPDRFDVRGDLTVGHDVSIDINVVVEGDVVIGNNSTVGPNNFLKNVSIGNNVTIKPNCVIEDAIIGDNCVVGPFARVRPNTQLESGARIGNFVEVKNAKIGKNSKASHLSYIGDSVVGDEVNIGAGTITCNYDGITKHQTIIEDMVFVGSNTALVAPIKIGKGAMIGAGSVIASDVPSEKLTLARAKQITIENWKRKEKE